MSEIEEWRPIPSLPGFQASSLGRVRSPGRWGNPKVLAPQLVNPFEYFTFNVYVNYTRSRKLIHVAVAEAFHGPKPPGMEVRHLDGDAFNNRPENLRYGTHSENVRDTVRHGTNHNTRKTHCPQGHEYTPENTKIQKKGGRLCRKCQVAHGTAYRRRRRLQERAA